MTTLHAVLGTTDFAAGSGAGSGAGGSAGPTIDSVTPETLHPLLLELAAGQDTDRFLLLTDSSRREGDDARARPTTDGRWRVRIRRGSLDRIATAPNADAAFDLLRSWAADDGWWAEAFDWAPTESGFEG